MAVVQEKRPATHDGTVICWIPDFVGVTDGTTLGSGFRRNDKGWNTGFRVRPGMTGGGTLWKWWTFI